MDSKNGIINTIELNQRLSGDIELLRELVQIFAKDSITHLNRIRESIHSGDAEKIVKSAHTLKGSVANFSAKQAYESALTLERTGRNRDISKSKAALEDLEKKIFELTERLKEISSGDSLL